MFYFCFRVPSGHPFFAELVARCASRVADGLAPWRPEGRGLVETPIGGRSAAQNGSFCFFRAAQRRAFFARSLQAWLLCGLWRQALLRLPRARPTRDVDAMSRAVACRCVACRAVAHGVLAVWQRVGNAQPPSRREVSKPASVCGLATALPSISSATAFRQQLRHSKRSGSGERSGVAHGVLAVWQRVGNAQPPSRRDGNNTVSFLELAPLGRSRPRRSTPRRSSRRAAPFQQRPCAPRAGWKRSAKDCALSVRLRRAPFAPHPCDLDFAPKLCESRKSP